MLKGLSVEEAEKKLKGLVKSSSEPMLKLVRSAAANAKENHKQEKADLLVKNVRVTEGSRLKRFRPRAHGRASLIQKRSSHVTMTLSEREKPAVSSTDAEKVADTKEDPKKKAEKKDT